MTLRFARNDVGGFARSYISCYNFSMLSSRDQLDRLIAKYGGAVPRYTSYPTAPEWKQEYNPEVFEEAIIRSNQSDRPLSLYVHIPFCESQCYYCGCNVIISPEHGIETQYLNRLKAEINYLAAQVSPDKPIMQIAFGGGTPTYLTPEQLLDLAKHIRVSFNLQQTYHDRRDRHEYAIEIDPRVTSTQHLEAIYQSGFNRLSMGIQDFNPETQETINRIQPYELVDNIVKAARQQGFRSINFDLIYGLPYQTLETFRDTIAKVIAIKPERIALFNYAHIPSIFPFQRKYIPEDALPDQQTKMDIFDMAVCELTKAGYVFIGLDHFALPDDELSLAQESGSIYRNFQGYTTHAGCDLLGIGVTAISDIAGVYKQNHKKLNQYYSDFGADKFLRCSQDDITRREMIKQIMCNGELGFIAADYQIELERLQPYVDDGLIVIARSGSDEVTTQGVILSEVKDPRTATQRIASPSARNDVVVLKVTELGRYLVRNIASCFDNYLHRDSAHKLFSKAV